MNNSKVYDFGMFEGMAECAGALPKSEESAPLSLKQ